jgi:hypothetical protein
LGVIKTPSIEALRPALEAACLVDREARIVSRVKCAECGAEADEKARRWRALIGEEWETDGSLFVVSYKLSYVGSRGLSPRPVPRLM